MAQKRKKAAKKRGSGGAKGAAKKSVSAKKRTVSKKSGMKTTAKAKKKSAAKKKVSKAVKKKSAKKTSKKTAKKKTSRKRKASGRKSVSEEEAGLTDADLEYFREALLVKRRELLMNVLEMENEALRQSRLDAAGDLSSMPIHMADLGTDNFEQEFALGLMDSERRLLREIDEALARIEEKTYGLCQATGKPIRRARLDAKPWARYCVEYARLIEEGKVPAFDEEV